MYFLLMLLLGTQTGPMRCGDLLIAPGATTLEVVAKCGEPDLRERVSGADMPLEEIWIYVNPSAGTQKLLHFSGVKLVQIANAGSATWTHEQMATFRCGDKALRAGNTKLDVRKACGAPEMVERVSSSAERSREIWLYLRDGRTVTMEFAGVELQRVELGSL